MFREIPILNKFVHKKDQNYVDNILKEKLRTIKQRKNKFKLNKSSNLKYNKKKLNISKNNINIIKIKKENKILFNKIINIAKLNKKNKSYSQENKKSSLNEKFRKKELLRITCENFNILKRINSIKPIIKKKELDIHKNKYYNRFKLHCELPLIINKKSNLKKKMNFNNKNNKFNKTKKNLSDIKYVNYLKLKNESKEFSIKTCSNLNINKNKTYLNQKINSEKYKSNNKITKKLETIVSENFHENKNKIKKLISLDNGKKVYIIINDYNNM